ncbi:MAG TPA: hypothetical protein DCE23_06380 [Firmicutes bacterium]|nr:hypothetical protein [Bacillota bacterium]
MKNVSFDYKLLLDDIDKKYKGEKIEYKINKFCQEIKIKTYRFKKILEAKAYFQNDEIYRIMTLLNINDNEISNYFFKVV